MGMRGPVSCSSYTVRVSKSSLTNACKTKPLPNPNPNNYHVLSYEYVAGFLIVHIKYLDCTNFEGEKILVFQNCTFPQLQKQKAIDPHFSDNEKYLSPIARFVPTEYGMDLARAMCRALKE